MFVVTLYIISTTTLCSTYVLRYSPSPIASQQVIFRVGPTQWTRSEHDKCPAGYS